MINSVTLIGRLTHDPEIKVFDSGNVVCNFSLALTSKDKNNQEISQFFKCNAWGKQAENLHKFQKKGALIGVEGQLQHKPYTNKKGVKINDYVIFAKKIIYLQSKNQSSLDYQETNTKLNYQNQTHQPIDSKDDDAELP